MSKIRKAVIPAAGLGTRMKPITNYLPKTMLPLGKKPVLQHIVEELKGAGITEIAVVVRTEHESIAEYFSEDTAISFLYDDTTSGPGGAVLEAESFIGGDDFWVILSDAPVLGTGHSDHLVKLMDIKNETDARAALSIYKVPQSEISSRGIVVLDKKQVAGEEAVQLKDIIEKPGKERDTGNWASACRYCFEADIFAALKNSSTDKDGELQLTSAIRYLIQNKKRVVGYPLPRELRRYDTGSFEGYFQAIAAFASGNQ